MYHGDLNINRRLEKNTHNANNSCAWILLQCTHFIIFTDFIYMYMCAYIKTIST